jgi:hypothetical protein
MATIAKPIKLPTASGNVVGLSTTGYVSISGIAGIETGGFPVTAVIRSGGSTGPVVTTVNCAASGAATGTGFAHPVQCTAPLYCQIIGTGVLDGAVHVL